MTKSAPVSLESLAAAVPTPEDEPYYDQVPVDVNDGEYVYIQAGMIVILFRFINLLFIMWFFF